MDNAGFSENGAPIRRGVSYTSRKISTDYNANDFHDDDEGGSKASRSGSGGAARKTSASRKVSALPDLAPEDPNSRPWAQKTGAEKAKTVLFGVSKFVGLLTCLYFFICSLDLLGSGFNLLGGEAVGKIFQQSTLLQNPVCGLMIGVMATVMVQSSSTSTSIVVAMTASEIIPIRIGIPIIMGANVGTSVTNTLVSLAQVGDRDQFERAFAGATVHDMFNWLSVIVLLPLEMATHYLYHLTDALLANYGVGNSTTTKLKLLTVLTEPLTDVIVQIDKSAIKNTAVAGGGGGGGANSTAHNGTTSVGRVLKVWCKDEETVSTMTTTTPASLTLFADAAADATAPTTPPGMVKCYHLFANFPQLTDAEVGAIILVVSLLVLCTSLIFLVKILNGVFKGSVGKILQKFLNAEFPGVFSFLTGYAAMLVGALVTILVQSSSVFTSTLTPLVGLGAVTIERFYPLTLGSNIGTTFTAMMAAFAARGSEAKIALQIALCHLFFNLSGILLFFPVPFLRKMPIRMAQALGAITAEYRWFCAVYVIFMFLVAPAFILGLSMGGAVVFGVVFGIIVLFLVVVAVINVIQNKRPVCLPAWLRNWDFLPLPLHSLEPYDRVIVGCALKCCGCCDCAHNLQRDAAAAAIVENGDAETGRKSGVDNAGLDIRFDAKNDAVAMDRY